MNRSTSTTSHSKEGSRLMAERGIVLHEFEVEPVELTPEFASGVDLPYLPWLRHRAVERLLTGAALQAGVPIQVSEHDNAVHIGHIQGKTEDERRALWLDPARRVPFFLFMGRGTLKGAAKRLNNLVAESRQ